MRAVMARVTRGVCVRRHAGVHRAVRRRPFHTGLVPRQQGTAAPGVGEEVAREASKPKRSLVKTVVYGAAASVAAFSGMFLYQAATDGEFRRDIRGIAPGAIDSADAVLAAVFGVDGGAAEAHLAPVRAFVGDVIAARQPVLVTLASGAVHSVDADAGDMLLGVKQKLVAQCPDCAEDDIADVRFVDAADGVPANTGPLAPDLVRRLRAAGAAPRCASLVGPPSSAGAGELRYALGRARVHEASLRGEIRRKAAARARAKARGRTPLDADWPYALSVDAHNAAVDELTEVMRAQEILAARVRAVEGGFRTG